MTEFIEKMTLMEYHNVYNLCKIPIMPYSQLLRKKTPQFFYYKSFENPNIELFFIATIEEFEPPDANKYLMKGVQLLGIGYLTTSQELKFDFLESFQFSAINDMQNNEQKNNQQKNNKKILKSINNKWYLLSTNNNGKNCYGDFIFNKVNANLKIYLQKINENANIIAELEKIQNASIIEEENENDEDFDGKYV